MSTTVNIHDAKTHLSRLLERVRNGEEVVIAKAGKPTARLVAIQAPLEGLPIITADPAIAQYDVEVIW